jgi:nucleoside 2-deoxyribosyltransferase
MIETGKGANTEQERIRRATRWLRDFARWFDRVGGADLPSPADPSVLWTVFERDYKKRAGQVFIAMSFRESKTLEGVQIAFEEAIEQFNKSHPNSPLDPKRIDKQAGASYEIPAHVFKEIDNSRLVIADLTDEKPNVYCEVGYAKAREIPFILTFHKDGTSPANKVHFDLVPYRYIEYDNPMDLRNKLKHELDAWHDNN